MTTTNVIERMIGQIGWNNILATSGGRYERPFGSENTLLLPCGRGYAVRVTYNPVPDTYTVERSFRRGLKEWIKGRADNVYYDQLPEQVYRAGCFNDDWPEGGARA